MIKNRISKYFRSEVEPHQMIQPPKVNASAFVAMPTAPQGMTATGQAPAGPMNIYEIALADAQRKVAESHANEADDFGELSDWFDENL